MSEQKRPTKQQVILYMTRIAEECRCPYTDEIYPAELAQWAAEDLGYEYDTNSDKTVIQDWLSWARAVIVVANRRKGQ